MNPEHLEANRRMWDERVSVHLKSAFYDVPGFLAGTSHLRDFERPELGDVRGRSLLHLQCHFGLDTLSWAREGAEVTGLDFSASAIATARDIARDAKLEATFVEGDVHDAAKILHRTFDIVYTGFGAICWLPDIRRWAEVAWKMVRPGGIFYMSEFHPFTDIFDEDDLTVANHYFDRGVPFVDESGATYTEGSANIQNTIDYTWTHPVSTVITALLDQGFRLELFQEHDYTLFPRFPSLEHHPEDRTYRLPEHHPRLPLMYSIRMVKPSTATS